MASSSGLIPGKIQALPIQVVYNLPTFPSSRHHALATSSSPVGIGRSTLTPPTEADYSSNAEYTTILPHVQDVFVHKPLPTASSRRRLAIAGKRRRTSSKSPLPQSTIKAEDTAESSNAVDGEDDRPGQPEEAPQLIGSVSLKAVLKGVCMASPEVLLSLESQAQQSEASTLTATTSNIATDVSVYAPLLTTTLRPSSNRSLVDQSTPTTPNLGGSSPRLADAVNGVSVSAPEPPQEGKGLLSWILDETDPGKSLVKGRLIRSYEFSIVAAQSEDEDGLQALLAAETNKKRKRAKRDEGQAVSGLNEQTLSSADGDEEEEDEEPWGLQVIISLRSLPVSSTIPKRKVISSLFAKSSLGHSKLQTSNTASSMAKPASPARVATKAMDGTSAPPSRPMHIPPITPPAVLQRLNTQPLKSGDSGPISAQLRSEQRPPMMTPQAAPQSGSSALAIKDSDDLRHSPRTMKTVARSMLAGPTLTLQRIELAQKIVCPEDFKQLLDEMGVSPHSLPPIQSATNPPRNEVNGLMTPKSPIRPLSASNQQPSSRPAALQNSSSTHQQRRARIFVCDHCKTTETSMWRVKTLPGGGERRVCNDCGLYFNRTKTMRPKELWGRPESGPALASSAAHTPVAAPDAETEASKALSEQLSTPRRSSRLSSSRGPQDGDGSGSPKNRGRTTPSRSAKSNKIVNHSSQIVPPSTKAQKQMMSLTKPKKVPESSPPFQPAPAGQNSEDTPAPTEASAAIDSIEPAPTEDDANIPKFSQRELEMLLLFSAQNEDDGPDVGAAMPSVEEMMGSIAGSSPWVTTQTPTNPDNEGDQLQAFLDLEGL